MAKVFLKTYGCQMNERDSEQVARQLLARGYELTGAEAEADVVLLNTCSVRDQAEQKAIGKMGMLHALHRDRPETVFGFLGCMAQSRGAGLLAEMPRVDLVVGTQKFHRVADYVDEAVARRRARQTENPTPRRPAPGHRRRGGRGRFAGDDPRTRPAPRAAECFRVDHAGLQHALHVLHRARHARGGAFPARWRKSSPRSARWSPAG